MKILLITNIFPPHIGGPATFIDRLARTLAEQGHRVTVVCSSDSPAEVTDGERPFVVKRMCLANRERYEIHIRATLLKEMMRHRFILVNGLESYVSQVAEILKKDYVLKIVGDTVWETARNRGETVLDIDTFQSDMREQSRFRIPVERRNRSIRRAKAIFTPCDYLRRMVIGWGFPQERVVTIRNGIALEDYENANARRRTSTDPFRVLYVGRLTNWKGVETLLLATRGMANTEVAIVGSGPELPHLLELARQLGIADMATFEGPKGSREIYLQMSRSHVIVLTSLYEGLSHTLLEAMATGVPCIASDCGGNREVVLPGESGVLVPPQDVEALSKNLRWLMEDEQSRFRMANGAKAASSAFNLSDTIQKVMDLVNSAL